MAANRVRPATGRRSPVRWFILGVVLLLLIWLGAKAWRINQSVQSLLSHQAEAEILIANGVTNIDPVAAETLILAVRQDVLSLKRETAVLMALNPFLGWPPYRRLA
jgi:cell division protein FtsB